MTADDITGVVAVAAGTSAGAVNEEFDGLACRTVVAAEASWHTAAA